MVNSYNSNSLNTKTTDLDFDILGIIQVYFDIRISNFRVVEGWVKLKKKIIMRKCHYLRQNL